LTNSEDLENIKGLCRLFWAKSYADQLLFDETFDIEVDKQLQAVQKKEQQNTFSSEQNLLSHRGKYCRFQSTFSRKETTTEATSGYSQGSPH